MSRNDLTGNQAMRAKSVDRLEVSALEKQIGVVNKAAVDDTRRESTEVVEYRLVAVGQSGACRKARK